MVSATEVQEKFHSPLGASQAHRWMNCAGSVALIRKLVEKHGSRITDAGYEADLGTAAHSLMEACLTAEPRADAWEGLDSVFTVKGRDFKVDMEMTDAVQVVLDLVDRLMEEHADRNPQLFVELPLSSISHDLAAGTADIVILVPNVKIIVIDYKHGIQVNVEPDSVQNRYYGRLALESEELGGWVDTVKDIDLYIVQPRQPHPKGPVRPFTTTPWDLRRWWDAEVLPAMRRTEDPEASLEVGEHCRFCPAKPHCPAIKRETENFDASLDPVYLTDAELGAAMEKLDALVKTRKTLGEEAYRRVMKGADIPGFKLVAKKSSRVWRMKLAVTDDAGNEQELDLEEELAREFGDAMYAPKTILTAPQIEKLNGGKKFVKRWAFKPDTGLTLAAASDKRVAVRPPMQADTAPKGSAVEGLADPIDI